MKVSTVFTLLLTIVVSAHAQSFRSERLQDITYIEIKGNKVIYTDSVTLQVNERMGDQDAEISIVYQKDDKISFGNIWLEDAGGNIVRKLKKNEIKKRSYISNSSLYQDYFIQSFELLHNVYPYKVRFSYKREINKFVDISSLDLSNYGRPVKEGKLTIEHPIDKVIKIMYNNIDKYSVDTLEKTLVHRWNYSHTPNNHNQVYRSINTSSAPRIIASPTEFKFGVDGENMNWETFGNWIHRLNFKRDKLPNSETTKIDLLVSEISDEREKIIILYEYLQDNTRYINVSTKHGGLQTYPAEYVVKNKYGDCKALTNYMQAILTHIGIKSYYTLIYSDNKVHDLDDNFSHNAFNHVILTVPLSTDTIFLECTSKNDPMGYVGSHIQGRKALVTKENESRLINMPTLSIEDVLCSRRISVSLGSNNDADILLQAKERGIDYEITNSYKNNTSKNNLENFLKGNILSKSYELINYTIEKTDKDSANISIEILCKDNNAYKIYGNDLVAAPIPLYIPKFEPTDSRVADVQIDYPIYQLDTISYHTNQVEIAKFPEDIEYSSPFGDIYSVRYEKKDKRNLIIYKSLLITPKRIELNNYGEFFNFIDTVRKIENTNLHIEIL